MNKTAKGALAAGTAVVLLTGGAGTLAYWNAQDEAPGGSFNAGKLTLDASSCDSAKWMRTNVLEQATPIEHLETHKIVPGDTLTKTCTALIGAQGEDLRAALAVTGGVLSVTGEQNAYELDSTFKVDNVDRTEVTEADAGKNIDVKITVAFNTGATNESMLDTLSLSDFVVTLTQASTAPAAPAV